MSVSEIKTRIYQDVRADSPATKSEGGSFDSVIDAAVQKRQCPACRPCYRLTQPETAETSVQTASESVIPDAGAEAAATDAAADTAGDTAAVDSIEAAAATETAEKSESAAKAGESLSVDEQNEGNRSAMYRFTMFVRISGDFGSLQQSLIDNFKEATVSYVNALKGQSEHGVEALDGYLNKAETSAAQGMESARSFIDEILSAAQTGLKVITSTLKSSAWMSGMNLNGSSSLSSMFSSSSSDSSSLFSTSSDMDLARLLLQSALESSEKATGDATAEMVDYGSGYKLAMLKGQELTRVDAAGNSKEEEAGLEVTRASKAIEQRNYLFERFLQLIDSMSSSIDGGTQVVRAGFSFAIDNGIIADYREVGKAVGAMNVSENSSSSDKTEPADAAEEIIA